ncbi:MAG: UDP-2,4-diacetamido-2,4,6-trideoxy-beta-L-altropyranose hydrolase [Rhodospirillaceae bacterium]|nr:UDP-2,4-diacetamido-2,4,6-trideoxy-beta-L-altropyranose hydrolase [Rhodospirillaceae bacterium]
MKIAIRADASAQIGSGHVVRCRTLARVLAQRGAEITFVSRDCPGNMLAALRAEGWTVRALPAAIAGENADSDATAAALAGENADWLIVDHYGLGVDWQKHMRPHAERIMAIDDMANRRHDCDLLMDQNFSLNPAARYQGLVPATAQLCLGPRYALLGGDYAALPYRPAVAQPVKRILVSFGGADLADMTGRALAALSAPEFDGIQVDLVAGPSYPHRARLETAAARRAGTTVLGPQPTLAGLLGAADVAIGAGGGTTWERARAGAPAVVITLADNQVPATRDLAAAGALIYAGAAENLSADALRDRLRGLLADPDARQRMTEAGQRMVDGRGAQRIAEVLLPSTDDALVLRPARADDRGFYFDLANEPDVRRQSFSTGPIPWPNHCAWFAGKLADPRVRLFVLEAQGLPVGQIRFDRDTGGAATLSYSLESFARGRGWGKKLVALGVETLRREGSVPITAEVRPENTASRRVFDSLGFVLRPGSPDGRLVYTLAP